MLFTKMLIFTCILLFASSAISKVAIIVHKDNDNAIDKHFMQRLYLGKAETYQDGSKATPLNVETKKLLDEFNDSIVNKSTQQLSAYWSRLIFTGKGVPPKVKVNEKAIIEAVKSNRDAIGYVSQNTKLPSGVRVINL